MAALDATTWWLLAAAYALLCLRVTLRVQRTGRNPLVWFFLVFFTAGIAAAVLFLRIGRRKPHAPAPDEVAAGRLTHCPHCGATFAPEEIDRTSGTAACPRCHLHLDDEVHLA